jgi:hypothetical protein
MGVAALSFLLATSATAPAMAAGFYGDGSSGALVINTDTDWTINPPAISHAMNFMFTSVTVNAKLTVPSGLIIRTTGDFVVGAAGTVVVERPPVFFPDGVSLIGDPGITNHGLSVGSARAVQILHPGIYGGTAGTSSNELCAPTTAGGGTLGLRVGGNLIVDGLISATGESGQACPLYTGGPVYGTGGAGGGAFIAAVQGVVSGAGTVDVSGGSGGNGGDLPSPGLKGQNGAGGGGGIIHIICPNVVGSVSLVVAGGKVGQGGSGFYGQMGGASGGNSGGYRVGSGGSSSWRPGNGYGGFIFFSQPASPEAYFSN